MRKLLVIGGWIVIALLTVIGISASLSQIPPGGDSYNPAFVENPRVTLAHVIPGIAFMVLGPLQFIAPIRNRFRFYHRLSGRLFVAVCLFIGFSGIVMVILFPFGGLNEQLAILVFAAFFLYSLARAFYHIRKREVAEHREWMIRVFSIGLGISLVRIFIALLSVFTEYEQIQFFAWTFWAGFILSWLTGEFWIRFSRIRSSAIIF